MHFQSGHIIWEGWSIIWHLVQCLNSILWDSDCLSSYTHHWPLDHLDISNKFYMMCLFIRWCVWLSLIVLWFDRRIWGFSSKSLLGLSFFLLFWRYLNCASLPSIFLGRINDTQIMLVYKDSSVIIRVT